MKKDQNSKKRIVIKCVCNCNNELNLNNSLWDLCICLCECKKHRITDLDKKYWSEWNKTKHFIKIAIAKKQQKNINNDIDNLIFGKRE